MDPLHANAISEHVAQLLGPNRGCEFKFCHCVEIAKFPSDAFVISRFTIF